MLRKLRYRWFNYKLRLVSMFIEKHKLYPVVLDKDLLEVWKNQHD